MAYVARNRQEADGHGRRRNAHQHGCGLDRLAQGFGENFYKTVNTILSNSEPLARGVHADEISIEVGNLLNGIVAGEMSIADGLAAIDAKITEIQSK